MLTEKPNLETKIFVRALECLRAALFRMYNRFDFKSIIFSSFTW